MLTQLHNREGLCVDVDLNVHDSYRHGNLRVCLWLQGACVHMNSVSFLGFVFAGGRGGGPNPPCTQNSAPSWITVVRHLESSFAGV